MKTINKRVLACVVIASAALPFSSAFATNGYFSHGYGTKNEALAGGGIALPQDAMIAATNPAGMVFVGERLDVGAAIFSPDRAYSTTGSSGAADGTDCVTAFGGGCPFQIGPQSITSDNKYFIVPSIAYNWMLNSDSSAGITVYGNGGMNTEYSGGTAQHDDGSNSSGVGPGSLITTNGTFGAGTTGVNLSQLFINGSYAHKIGSKASVGASLLFAYQQFKATGLAMFGGYSNSAANISNNGTDTSTGVGVKLGAQGEVAPGFTLAAAYQPKIKMSKFDKYKGLFAEQGEFDIPANVTLGAAWKVTKAQAATLDVQKIYYSKVKSIANPIGNLFTECSKSGQGATTDVGCLGGSDGAGFGWRDMTIVKLGYQFVTSPTMTWRVGYSKGKQPIPSDQVVFNILAPGVIEQHFTMGFTNKLSPKSELNFAAMYAPEKTVSGKNTFAPYQTVDIKLKEYQLELSYDKQF